jgi:hypothetical protein
VLIDLGRKCSYLLHFLDVLERLALGRTTFGWGFFKVIYSSL